MAGQITISTLRDDTGVLATQNGMTGIAKAWVNFNGTGTPAIRSSFNVSSVVRVTTGEYTINFSTAMPNTNFCALGDRSLAVSTANNYFDEVFASRTASSVRWQNGEGGALTDIPNANIAVFSS
jgi:hypothetical protein